MRHNITYSAYKKQPILLCEDEIKDRDYLKSNKRSPVDALRGIQPRWGLGRCKYVYYRRALPGIIDSKARQAYAPSSCSLLLSQRNAIHIYRDFASPKGLNVSNHRRNRWEKATAVEASMIT